MVLNSENNLNDDITIIKNSQDELQAVGLINQNDSNGATNPLKLWEGNKQQWDNGVVETYYAWKNSNNENIDNTTMTDTKWQSIAYGNGIFVAVQNSGGSTSNGISACSNDGINWSYGTIVSGVLRNVRKIIYGNGIFVAKSRNEGLWYSTDGLTWLSREIGNGYAICWDGEQFVHINIGTHECKISTNATSWISYSNTIGASDVQAIAYGKINNIGYYVVVNGNNGGIYYSNDLYDWNVISSGVNTDVIFAEDKFIVQSNGVLIILGQKEDNSFGVLNTIRYGDSLGYLSYDTVSKSLYLSLAYNSKNGIFSPLSADYILMIPYDDLLSSNPTITEINLPGTTTWTDMCFDDKGNGILISKYGEVAIILRTLYFTKNLSPTIDSDVYYGLNDISPLSIISVNQDTITLSDENTYIYTSKNNFYNIQSIGEVYPNLICGIEGVGFKKGNTLIGKEYTIFNGTNGIASGTSGLVPAPTISDANKFLNSDGTWKTFVVDQNYNSSSNNPQSSYGIYNAKFLNNNNDSASGLTILGTSNYANSVILGYSAEGIRNSVSVGAYSSAERNSISLGHYAGAISAESIQIGYGTIAGVTFSVGFSEYDNYQLLDGITGKIPNERILIDNEPVLNSTNAITSGTIYNIIGDIDSLIEEINNLNE